MQQLKTFPQISVDLNVFITEARMKCKRTGAMYRLAQTPKIGDELLTLLSEKAPQYNWFYITEGGEDVEITEDMECGDDGSTEWLCAELKQ